MTRELTAVEELRHPRNVGDLADDGLCLHFALFPFRPLGAALNPKSFQRASGKGCRDKEGSGGRYAGLRKPFD